MKKTDRKNKTNLTVTWPTDIFTIKELNAANPDFVEITLRVRLKKALESGEVNDVGVLHNGKGRPTSVFVHGTPTEAHIDEAKSREVILKDSLVVNVLKVDSNKTQTSNPAVITMDVDMRQRTVA
jgi:hypothetical protein